jgi:hypothetical protein
VKIASRHWVAKVDWLAVSLWVAKADRHARRFRVAAERWRAGRIRVTWSNWHARRIGVAGLAVARWLPLGFLVLGGTLFAQGLLQHDGTLACQGLLDLYGTLAADGLLLLTGTLAADGLLAGLWHARAGWVAEIHRHASFFGIATGLWLALSKWVAIGFRLAVRCSGLLIGCGSLSFSGLLVSGWLAAARRVSDQIWLA